MAKMKGIRLFSVHISNCITHFPYKLGTQSLKPPTYIKLQLRIFKKYIIHSKHLHRVKKILSTKTLQLLGCSKSLCICQVSASRKGCSSSPQILSLYSNEFLSYQILQTKAICFSCILDLWAMTSLLANLNNTEYYNNFYFLVCIISK